jgi:hypothetical protein
VVGGDAPPYDDAKDLSRLERGGRETSPMNLKTGLHPPKGGEGENVQVRLKRAQKRNPLFSMRLHDTQTGMLLGIPRSARCVQRFDDSLNSAIHITFRAFAAFFIDAKAKRSVVESCISFYTPRRGRRIRARIQAFVIKKGETESLPPRVHGGVGRGEVALSLMKISNDPSAGSPTETLLRLLLPLNDQV